MIDYRFIGWCREDSADKVWGVIELAQETAHPYNSVSKYVTFWGRRGNKLQTKVSSEYDHDIIKLIRSKERKGYVRVSRDQLDEVYPEFQTDLEKTAFWAMFKI